MFIRKVFIFKVHIIPFTILHGIAIEWFADGVERGDVDGGDSRNFLLVCHYEDNDIFEIVMSECIWLLEKHFENASVC